MSLSFHSLKVLGVEPVAEQAVQLRLAIPPALRGEFTFSPGQHVALRAVLEGREVRRTYSIVNAAPGNEIRLGIRVQRPGGLAHHLATAVRSGDSVEVLNPTGRFMRSAASAEARSYLALAAGSGITPVLAIMTAVLEQEPASTFVLIYGNRSAARTMYLEEIQALKNRFMSRLAVHFLMSQEAQENELFNGRLNGERVKALAGLLFEPASVDEVFICGPGSMVASTRDALRELGTTAPMHFERFTTTDDPAQAAAAPATTDEAAITIIQDGRRRSFKMQPGDASVLDAAARAGIDLPFACRSGVCSTCRARIVSGAATMAHNVALENWELEAGYILCCQARPTGPELELSYDS